MGFVNDNRAYVLEARAGEYLTKTVVLETHFRRGKDAAVPTVLKILKIKLDSELLNK